MHKLQDLALLASKSVIVEDILEQVNVWISDHASDTDIVLDNLGVDEEKRKRELKCTAHIILNIDDALENFFKSFEEKVRREIHAVGVME